MEENQTEQNQNVNSTPPVSPVVQTPPAIPPISDLPHGNSVPKSKFPLAIIIGIILLLLIAGSAAGFYIFRQQSLKTATKPTPMPIVQKPISSPTPTPNPTANWKTYTSKEASFSLKYPADMNEPGDIFYDDASKQYCTEFSNLTIVGNPDPKSTPGPVKHPETYIIVCAYPAEILTKPPLVFNDGTERFQLSSMTATTVNSYSSYIGTANSTNPSTPPEAKDQKITIIQNPQGGYVIILNQISEGINIYNKIVSTFKFIHQTIPPPLIFPTLTPTPTCMPRPACLDATPRCMITEPIQGWCK